MWAFARIGWGPASNAESDVSLICGLLRDDSPNDQILPPKLRTSPGRELSSWRGVLADASMSVPTSQKSHLCGDLATSG